MPKLRILSGRWGEGWKPGDVVEMDTEAARIAVEDGRLELLPGESLYPSASSVPDAPTKKVEERGKEGKKPGSRKKDKKKK